MGGMFDLFDWEGDISFYFFIDIHRVGPLGKSVYLVYGRWRFYDGSQLVRLEGKCGAQKRYKYKTTNWMVWSDQMSRLLSLGATNLTILFVSFVFFFFPEMEMVRVSDNSNERSLLCI